MKAYSANKLRYEALIPLSRSLAVSRFKSQALCSAIGAQLETEVVSRTDIRLYVGLLDRVVAALQVGFAHFAS